MMNHTSRIAAAIVIGAGAFAMTGCAAFADAVNLRPADKGDGYGLPHPTVLEQGDRCGGIKEGVMVEHVTANTVRLTVQFGVRKTSGYQFRLAAPALAYDQETDTVTVKINETPPAEDEATLMSITWPCMVLEADMWPDPEKVELKIVENSRVYDHQKPEFHAQ